jgi:spore cortex formation protein SpoVR/YcgB (stage V sporulation)
MAQKTTSILRSKKASIARKDRKKIEKTQNNKEKYPGLLKIMEEKMKKKNEKSTAKILEKYPDLLEKIEQKMKSEKLHPWVKEFAGIINKGKDED